MMEVMLISKGYRLSGIGARLVVVVSQSSSVALFLHLEF